MQTGAACKEFPSQLEGGVLLKMLKYMKLYGCSNSAKFNIFIQRDF